MNRLSRNRTITWALKGAAHHITYWNALSFGHSRARIVSAFPRSGSSWLSELLSAYYDFPCPRKYLLPVLQTNLVLHTHNIPPWATSGLFYLERDCEDVYLSLFFKRFDLNRIDVIKRPSNEIRMLFERFLRNESKSPWESPCPWGKHVRKGRDLTARKGAWIKYEELCVDVIGVLGGAIERVDGCVDRSRLVDAVKKLGSNVDRERGVAYTTASVSTWSRNVWYRGKAEELLERLKC